MKASNLTLKSDRFSAATASRSNKTHGSRLAMRFAATMILTALVAGSLYLGASVSASRTEPAKRSKGVFSEKIAVPPGIDVNGPGSILRTIAPLLMPQAGPTVVTYASDCVTPKSSFNLGEVVCAKTDGVDLVTVPGNHYMNWIDSQLNETNGGTITQNPQFFLFAPPTADTWKATIGRVTPPDSSIVGNPPIFTVSSDRPGIGIFEGDGGGLCTNTPKSLFNLQDTNKDVCAKVVGGQANQRILWSNAEFKLVQDVPLGTGENVFTLSALSSLGDWRVILYEPFGGSVYAVTPFTVIDAANPNADLSIAKNSADDTVAAGSQAVFTVQLTNLGPTDATNVQVTDGIPANTTFASFAAVSAPGGTNCALPAVGASSGQSVCTIPILARGETATFLAAYDVLSGTASGTLISNTASAATAQPLPTDPPAVPDPNNDNNSSTATLRVEGATAETCTLDCPANVVKTADTSQGGQPGAFVTFAAAVPSGNCGSVTNSPASGSFFTVGTHSIISQSELNAASCTFTVTVLDSTPPTITCPANVTVTAGAGETEANVDPGTPTIDASGGGTVTGIRSDDDADPLTPPKPLTDPYPVGATGIHWTVTDAGGRTASCDQSITVLEANARPAVTISCPANVSATAPEGSCEATISAATIGTPTTNPSDNDVVVTPQRSDGLSLSAPFPGGTTQITWTAHDNITNTSASCVQTVTVTVPGDTTPPTLTVPANISETTSSCTATIEDLGEATATDSGACGGGSVTISRSGVPPGNVFPTGTTLITYTATDGAGNTATAVQMVTVTEAVPPTITAPADVTASTGPGATSCGTVVSDASLGTAIANDNCPGVTVTRTGVPAGNNFPVGNTTVTYRATDRSGNFTEDTQVVTVIDNTVPVVTPPGPVTLFTGPGATSCGVTVTDLDTTLGVGTATDNCPGVGAVTRTGVPAGNVFPVGQTIVTYSVTDAHGNTDSETQTVTVIDNTKPVFTSTQPDIVLEPTCPSGAIATYAFPTATDNCGVQSIVRTAGLASGSVFPIGTTTVTHTATDIHGNTETQSFTVTVKTVVQTIDDLKAAVTANTQLNAPQRNGLISKLDAAKQHYLNGNMNGACAKLADFVNSVQNFINNGTLSAATGNAWISTANNVRNTIGCTNNPCT